MAIDKLVAGLVEAGIYSLRHCWSIDKMADFEAISDDVLRETDVAYEQELQQNPYSVKLWTAYVRAKAGAKQQVRFLIYERAVKELPGSYKLWYAYLKERQQHAVELCITDPQYEATNN